MKRIFFLPLCMLLIAACSSESDQQGSENNLKPVEIKLKGGIETLKTLTRGEGVISGLPATTLNIQMSLYNAASASYTYNYTTFMGTPLAATINSAGSIDFATPQYYQANGYETQLIGWYPNSGTVTKGDGSTTANQIAFSIDGSTDIMLSNAPAASKSAPFSSSNGVLTFSHRLTQIIVEAYQENSDWGGIGSIAIVGEGSKTGTITLPSTFSTSAGSGNMALVCNDPNNSYGTILGSNNSTVYTDTNPLLLSGSSLSSKIACGYAMFAPSSNTTIELSVATVNGGTKNVIVTAPTTNNTGFEAGKAYTVTLKFSANAISPSAEISAWISQTATTLPIQ